MIAVRGADRPVAVGSAPRTVIFTDAIGAGRSAAAAPVPAQAGRVRTDELLRRQHGVLSRDQARAAGVSPRALRGRVRRGQLVEVFPGVHRSASHPASMDGLLVAASLWARPDGVLHGAAAACVLGMITPLPSWLPGPVGVTVPGRSRRRAPAGIRLRRRDLDPRDRLVHRGIAITARGLTALEAAIALPDGAAFLDRVLQRGLPLDEVYAAYTRAVGAVGAPRARDLLVEAADRADSRAERRLIGHLRRAGVDGWVRGLPFGVWTIDVAFPGPRVAIEVDGWAFHCDPARFRTDRRKQNALVAAGWTVLRFTWQDVRDRPEETVRRIRAALDT